MTVQQAIMLALQVSIMLTVFGFGLRATVGDVLYLVRQPSLLARSILATFVIVPVFAVAVTGVFALRDAAEIAIVALALSPIPPLLPQREGKGGGHAAYALGLMVVIGLLSIVITPLLVSVLNLVAVRSITSAPGAIAGIVLKAAVLPLAAGIALHATLPAVAARLAKPVTLIAHIMLVTGGLVVLIGATPQVVPWLATRRCCRWSRSSSLDWPWGTGWADRWRITGPCWRCPRPAGILRSRSLSRKRIFLTCPSSAPPSCCICW